MTGSGANETQTLAIRVQPDGHYAEQTELHPGPLRLEIKNPGQPPASRKGFGDGALLLDQVPKHALSCRGQVLKAEEVPIGARG